MRGTDRTTDRWGLVVPNGLDKRERPDDQDRNDLHIWKQLSLARHPLAIRLLLPGIITGRSMSSRLARSKPGGSSENSVMRGDVPTFPGRMRKTIGPSRDPKHPAGVLCTSSREGTLGGWGRRPQPPGAGAPAAGGCAGLAAGWTPATPGAAMRRQVTRRLRPGGWGRRPQAAAPRCGGLRRWGRRRPFGRLDPSHPLSRSPHLGSSAQ
jgi:hypothetical protein